MWTPWLISVAGVWMVLVPYLGFAPPAARAIEWTVGMGVAALALLLRRHAPIRGALAAALGAWLAGSGFLEGLLVGPALELNGVLTGIGLFLVGLSAGCRLTGEQCPPL